MLKCNDVIADRWQASPLKPRCAELDLTVGHGGQTAKQALMPREM
jgi:hypothetical protein